MEIIRDWKELKSVVDNTQDYSCVGFSKGTHLFNFTHDHLYNHSINKASKLFGIVWDNYYDAEIFNGNPAKPSEYGDDHVVSWFKEKGFDYLFIPDPSFIHEIMSFPLFKEIKNTVDNIWEKEGYYKYIGDWSYKGNTEWVKLVLSRHYLLYTDISGSKFINRSFQAVAPDGTWGFIYRHFWEKYCGGTFEMVPILRNGNGLAFDILLSKIPEDIKLFFESLVPFFNKFREDEDLDILKKSIYDATNKTLFRIVSFVYNKDEITLNKYVFRLHLDRKDRHDNYRLWEYGKDI